MNGFVGGRVDLICPPFDLYYRNQYCEAGVVGRKLDLDPPQSVQRSGLIRPKQVRPGRVDWGLFCHVKIGVQVLTININFIINITVSKPMIKYSS